LKEEVLKIAGGWVKVLGPVASILEFSRDIDEFYPASELICNILDNLDSKEFVGKYVRFLLLSLQPLLIRFAVSVWLAHSSAC
jgi:hypothetical protein